MNTTLCGLTEAEMKWDSAARDAIGTVLMSTDNPFERQIISEEQHEAILSLAEHHAKAKLGVKTLLKEHEPLIWHQYVALMLSPRVSGLDIGDVETIEYLANENAAEWEHGYEGGSGRAKVPRTTAEIAGTNSGDKRVAR